MHPVDPALSSTSSLYFAYGSNLSLAQMGNRVGMLRAVEGGRVRVPASLSGYRLDFSKVSKDGTGKANLRYASSDHKVEGVVYRLNPEQWKKLHRHEGFWTGRRLSQDPSGYTILKVPVLMGNVLQEAYTYKAEVEEARMVPPSLSYVKAILTGAKECRLPHSMLEQTLHVVKQTGLADLAPENCAREIKSLEKKYLPSTHSLWGDFLHAVVNFFRKIAAFFVNPALKDGE